ncbi:hypothetical protein BHM03_00046760 [Ensete ventricosum]|nr:hypothetical protein BHM03_00046760 [Ensete ventricosum]
MARPLQGWSTTARALQGRPAVAKAPTGVVDCCQGRLQAQPLATRATANRRDHPRAWLTPTGAGACGCRQHPQGWRQPAREAAGAGARSPTGAAAPIARGAARGQGGRLCDSDGDGRWMRPKGES